MITSDYEESKESKKSKKNKESKESKGKESKGKGKGKGKSKGKSKSKSKGKGKGKGKGEDKASAIASDTQSSDAMLTVAFSNTRLVYSCMRYAQLIASKPRKDAPLVRDNLTRAGVNIRKASGGGVLLEYCDGGSFIGGYDTSAMIMGDWPVGEDGLDQSITFILPHDFRWPVSNKMNLESCVRLELYPDAPVESDLAVIAVGKLITEYVSVEKPAFVVDGTIVAGQYPDMAEIIGTAFPRELDDKKYVACHNTKYMAAFAAVAKNFVQFGIKIGKFEDVATGMITHCNEGGSMVVRFVESDKSKPDSTGIVENVYGGIMPVKLEMCDGDESKLITDPHMILMPECALPTGEVKKKNKKDKKENNDKKPKKSKGKGKSKGKNKGKSKSKSQDE